MINITVNNNNYNLLKNQSLKTEDFDSEMYVYNPITDNIVVLNTTSRFIFCWLCQMTKDQRCTVKNLLSEIKKEYIMTIDDEVAFEEDLQLLLDTMIAEGVFYVQ